MLKFFILFLISLLTFLSLASQNWDIQLLRKINDPYSKPSDVWFSGISDSESWISVGVPVGLGITALLKNDDVTLRKALIIATGSLVTSGITTTLKYSVDRPRPFITYQDLLKKSGGGSPSFPSGHTSAAFSTATSLSLEFPKWYVVVPAYTWAGLVGYSRMELGVHYPSDVFVGAIIGASTSWLCYKLNQKLHTVDK